MWLQNYAFVASLHISSTIPTIIRIGNATTIKPDKARIISIAGNKTTVHMILAIPQVALKANKINLPTTVNNKHINKNVIIIFLLVKSVLF